MPNGWRKAAALGTIILALCGGLLATSDRAQAAEAAKGTVSRAVEPTVVVDKRIADNGIIPEGGPTLSPLAFVRFCLTYRVECSASDAVGRAHMSDVRWTELDAINRAINRRLVPRSDHNGTTPWTLDADAGDCNIFAVQKRHALLVRGWPTKSLSLALVVTRGGKGHLVLVVRTDHGDVVLDNLAAAVLPWRANTYRWLKIQALDNPSRWVEVKTVPARTPAYQLSATLRQRIYLD